MARGSSSCPENARGRPLLVAGLALLAVVATVGGGSLIVSGLRGGGAPQADPLQLGLDSRPGSRRGEGPLTLAAGAGQEERSGEPGASTGTTSREPVRRVELGFLGAGALRSAKGGPGGHDGGAMPATGDSTVAVGIASPGPDLASGAPSAQRVDGKPVTTLATTRAQPVEADAREAAPPWVTLLAPGEDRNLGTPPVTAAKILPGTADPKPHSDIKVLLRIRTPNLEGAVVTVNRRTVGTAPVDVDASVPPPGDLEVQVRKPGHATATRVIRLGTRHPGGPVDVELELPLDQPKGPSGGGPSEPVPSAPAPVQEPAGAEPGTAR